MNQWRHRNREFLALAIDRLHVQMQGGDTAPVDEQIGALYERMDGPPALIKLAEAFRLDAFERDVVLMTAADQVDPRFDETTISHALETLPGASWDALDDAATLLRTGILRRDTDAQFGAATLTLAHDVLRFLLGFDPRRTGQAAFTLEPATDRGLPTHARAAEDLARAVALTVAVNPTPPAIEIHGGTDEDRRMVAALTAARLGAEIAHADLRDLPAPGEQLDDLLQTWNRICALTDTQLLVTGADDEDPLTARRVARMLDRVARPFFVLVRRPTTLEASRVVIRHQAPELTIDERTDVWLAAVAESAARLLFEDTAELLAGEIAQLAAHFRLSAAAIEAVCLQAEALHHEDEPPERFARRLGEGCRRIVRARLDPLAERVPVDDVPAVELPARERRELDEIARQIRFGPLVDTRWGLGRGREAGVTALFAGAPGTGKTLAAAELANATGLDLYRINVAAVLSKYIGETEQNLDRIFEAARIGGAILLFDEADALFGKRTEVKDAHDRYANLGTAYLLQRIEHAPTPTILTTNVKDALDPAFTRRLHFMLDFPFPDEQARERIWTSIYPAQVPRRRLDPARLARLAVTGATIGNIARRGAFRAAADTGAVEMSHLRESARDELLKQDRVPADDETGEW
jgi:hypothetical protein